MSLTLIIVLVVAGVFFLLLVGAVFLGMTSKRKSGHLPGGRKANRSRK